jgi:hypothetical protein
MGGRKNRRPGLPERPNGALRPAPPIGSGLQKRLQNQHRRHLVDDSFAPDRSVPGVVEMSVRLSRRKPLVPKMHRCPELRPQVLSKRLRLGRLRALVTRHIQRVPYHHLRHPMLAQHPRHRLEVRAPPSPMQRKQGLRCISQRVRDRQSNPPVPNIKPQNPWDKRPLRLPRLLSFQIETFGFRRIFHRGLECNGRTVK